VEGRAAEGQAAKGQAVPPEPGLARDQGPKDAGGRHDREQHRPQRRAAEHPRKVRPHSRLRGRRTPRYLLLPREQRLRRVPRPKQHRRRLARSNRRRVRQVRLVRPRDQVVPALRPHQWNTGSTTGIIATSMGCSGRSGSGAPQERRQPRRPHSIGSG